MIKLTEFQHLLIDQSKDLIWAVNHEFQLVYANKTYFSTMQKITGVEKKLNGSAFIEDFGNEDIEKWKSYYKRALQGEFFEIEEHYYQPELNEIQYAQTTFQPIKDENDEITAVSCNSRDITDKVEQQHRLKLLESFTINTNDGVLITEANPFDKTGYSVIYVNDAFTKITGYKEEDVIGKSPGILHGQGTNIEELVRLRKAMRNWKTCETTNINYKKNGEKFWVNITMTPVSDKNGNFTHWVTIGRDITEQKIKEQELYLYNTITDVFHQCEDNNIKSYLIDVCEQISNFNDIDFAEIWLPAIDAKTINRIAFKSQVNAGKTFYEITKDIQSFNLGEGLPGYIWQNKKMEIWSNLEEKWITKGKLATQKAGIQSMMGIPLIHKEEVIGILTLGSRKTKLVFEKHTELLLKIEPTISAKLSQKKTEIELTQIFNFSLDIICVLGFDGYIKRANPATLDILGYSLEELSSKPITSFVHVDDRGLTEGKIKELYKGGKVYNFENRFITKQGKIVWLSWTATSMPENGGIYGTAKNITREKKLNNLNRQVLKINKTGSWKIDLEVKNLFWSDEIHKLHETDPKLYVPDYKSAIDFYRTDFRQLVLKNIKDCIYTGKDYDFEAVIVTAKNKEIWVRSTGSSEFIDGKCRKVFGSLQDINEQKLASIKLNKSLKSLKDYQFALDQSSIIAFTDAKGVITTVNDNFCEISKFDRSEMIGQTHQIINSKHHSKEFFNDLWRTISSGEVWRGEIKNKAKDGSFYWVHTTIVPFLDKTNKPFQYLAIRFDITLRKESGMKLQLANERFEKVSEATNDVIWDWDLTKQSVFRSKTVEMFFGDKISKLHISKDLWISKIYPEDLSRIKSSLDIAISDPTCNRWESEYRLFNEQGETLYFIDRGVIIRDNKGKAIRMVGAMTDLTNQKQMEIELQAVNKDLQTHTVQLERSNEELEQFAFIASHDLQEPLRMISSFMDLLKNKYEDQLDDKAQKYIHFAIDGALRMKQIILDLLDYSKAGKLMEDYVTIDLNQIIDDYKVLRRKIITERKVIILSDPLPIVKSFKTPITQTIHTLIDNAIKYSKEGEQPKIEIRVSENKNEWIIAVKDKGIGIDKHFFNKIFIMFQRLHDKDKYEGTGIGLSIAKKSIEACNGRIWVESIEDEGSTFYFTINKNKI